MAAQWPIKFTDEAKPGKVLKRKRAKSAVKDSKEKRTRLFIPTWQTGRPWLQFDSDKGMTCSWFVSMVEGALRVRVKRIYLSLETNYNRRQEKDNILIAEESHEVERER
jgi:hypothetical protein